MKRSIVAAVTAVAFAFPAMAQSQSGLAAGQSQSEPSQQYQGGQNGAQLPEIDASDLRTDQIRELQQALNMKGFDAGDVDGVWGPETEDAVRAFQREQGMDVTGEPNRQTIYALGFKSVGDEPKAPTQSGTVGSGASSPNQQSQGEMNQSDSHMNSGDMKQNGSGSK